MTKKNISTSKLLTYTLLLSLINFFIIAKTPDMAINKRYELLNIFIIQSYADLTCTEDIEKPPFDLFERGIIGYLNLLADGKKINNDKLTLIDFRRSSKLNRMWIIDMKGKRILYERLVAHGKNTGEDYATDFSNITNSNQSSLGFYLTGENYIGKHGLSLRLDGIEMGFNDMARSRAIVIHAASYVHQEFIKNNGRLGRSFGCPAIAFNKHIEIIKGLANQSLVFIYYPQQKYEAATLLNNKEKAEEYLANNPETINTEFLVRR